MGSLPEDDRLAQAMERWRRYDRLSSKQPDKADKALHDLAVFCAPEIAEAFNGFKKGGNIWVSDVEAFIRELAVIAARRAAQTLRDKPGRNLLHYVKRCVGDVLREREAEQRNRLRQLTAEQALGIATRLPRDQAAFVLDRLSQRQRHALIELVHRHKGGEGRREISLNPRHEPKDALLWLVWYAARRNAEHPLIERASTRENRPPQTFVLIDPGGKIGTQRKNKRGEPIDLAGPMHAKTFAMLGRELSERGYPIKDPLGKPRIAKSLGVSRDIVRRYLKRADELPDPFPDGGGVTIKFTLGDLLRSAQIAKGYERGPKPGRPPQDSQ